MENVRKSESTDLAGITPPPPPLTAPPPPVEAAPAKQQAEENGNPGAYEDLHKKCKEVYPIVFDGLKLLINKGLSNNFQVTHSLMLNAATAGEYHFGATYVGSKEMGPQESYPVMIGDIDTEGSLQAQIIHQVTKESKVKFVAQTQKSKWMVVQGDCDYKGKDFTASLTVANPDILNGSGIFVAHYLQNMTSKLSLGAELLYHTGAGQRMAVLTLAGRYTAKNWIAALSLGQTGWHASYWHQGNENMQVGVEYEYTSRAGDSSVSLGYQLDVPKANLVFKGMVDTNWTVAATFEKKLLPLPFNFALSGTLNHWKNQARFGIGLTIG